MDQLWSAIIAGLAGLLGAAVGGHFARSGAIEGAKTSADAIAHQVEQQRANELQHWVRQERRNAYDEVIRAHGVLARHLAVFRVALDRNEFRSELREVVDEAWAALSVACSSTHLFGPASVFEAAERLRHATLECVEEHRAFAVQVSGEEPGALPWYELSSSRRAMKNALTEFTTRCREALEVPARG